jgi:hypothetical protein
MCLLTNYVLITKQNEFLCAGRTVRQYPKLASQEQDMSTSCTPIRCRRLSLVSVTFLTKRYPTIPSTNMWGKTQIEEYTARSLTSFLQICRSHESQGLRKDHRWEEET